MTTMLKRLYDEINDAIESESAQAAQARMIVIDIAAEVGVNLFENIEGGAVWSHTNLLRIVRAVQGLRHEVSRLKGLPTGSFSDPRAPIPPLSVRGW